MRHAAIVGSLGISLIAPPGLGGIVVQEDLRSVSARAESWSGGTRRYVEDAETHAFGASGLIIAGAFTSWEGAVGSVQAWEESLVATGGRIESRGHVVGHTITNDDPDDAQRATVFGAVHYELAFTLTTDALARYEAWTEGGAAVELFDAGGNVVFSGGGLFEQTLSAGDYRLLAGASMFIESEMVSGPVFGGADYWVSLTVPGPGALAALVPGLALIARRRRR